MVERRPGPDLATLPVDREVRRIGAAQGVRQVLAVDIRGRHRRPHGTVRRRVLRHRPGRRRVRERRRVVDRGHVDGHRVGLRAGHLAVADLELEGRISIPVRVLRRGEHQLANVRRRDLLVQGHGRAVERERPRTRQLRDRHGKERIPGVRVGKPEVRRRERVRRVLGHRHRLVRTRRRRVVCIVIGDRDRHVEVFTAAVATPAHRMRQRRRTRIAGIVDSIVHGGHGHLLRLVPVAGREGQRRRSRGRDARSIGHRHRHVRRRLAVQHHRVAALVLL